MMDRRQVERVMRAGEVDPDRVAVEMVYRGADGVPELRRCSPIRRIAGGWTVMCLAAGEPRRLNFDGIVAAWPVKASDCLIPCAKVVVG
jgi:hypothetical protein